MGLSGIYCELIYHDDIVYEDWIDSRFILVYNAILVIMQGYKRIMNKVFKVG